MALPDIAELRAEIDAIDDKIIALFNDRSALVRRVGKIKKDTQKPGICYIRAGREADLVRSIYARFKEGIFPAEAAARMWRLVISASLTLESGLRIAAHDPEPDNRAYWLAREYFGNFLPISRKKTASALIKDIAEGKAQAGVLPVKGKAWWADMPEDIKIFACVPFVLRKGESVEALAVARLQPEPSMEDVSLIKLTARKMLTQNAVSAFFRKHGMKAKLLDCKGRDHLIELPGFFTGDSEILAAIQEETGFALSVLGSYAAPLIIE